MGLLQLEARVAVALAGGRQHCPWREPPTLVAEAVAPVIKALLLQFNTRVVLAAKASSS